MKQYEQGSSKFSVHYCHFCSRCLWKIKRLCALFCVWVSAYRERNKLPPIYCNEIINLDKNLLVSIIFREGKKLSLIKCYIIFAEEVKKNKRKSYNFNRFVVPNAGTFVWFLNNIPIDFFCGRAQNTRKIQRALKRYSR